MHSLNKNMTEMIQQSAMSIAKQTKKQKKPKISSPTRALMKKLGIIGLNLILSLTFTPNAPGGLAKVCEV